MRLFDEAGRELTWEEALARSPRAQARLAENERVLTQSRDDVVETIARRLMAEPHPPATWADALELAREAYDSATEAGE